MQVTCSVDGCDLPVKTVKSGLCNRHYLRWQRYGDPLESRKWRPWQEQVRERIGPEDDNGCWPWLGHVNPDGYGVLNRRDWSSPRKAHRLVYELLVGPIPDGHDLDHICHDPLVCTLSRDCPHRRCVNPAHCHPATRGENTLRGNGKGAQHARKTHCIHGHSLEDPDNVYVYVWPRTGKSRRMCKTCGRERQRAAPRRKPPSDE